MFFISCPVSSIHSILPAKRKSRYVSTSYSLTDHGKLLCPFSQPFHIPLQVFFVCFDFLICFVFTHFNKERNHNYNCIFFQFKFLSLLMRLNTSCPEHVFIKDDFAFISSFEDCMIVFMFVTHLSREKLR